MAAARRGNWKFVRDGDAQFLFDLDADVGERSNQFFKRADIAADLREALMEWGQSLTSESR
jgi:arylsulfatase A-like enzyme